MSRVNVLIIRAPGTNCDGETAFAFQLAGASTSLCHVNQFIRHDRRISDYQILVIPGGLPTVMILQPGRSWPMN
jgi:phosphoribosylformylglycinamidine synthase subunit PurQ / glutaminase